jgi:hypothetical protein
VDVDTLRQLVNTIRKAGREPILYFDPSKPGHYLQEYWEEALHMPHIDVKKLALLKAVGKVARVRKVSGVVVLSDDLYALAKDRLGAHVAVEVRSDDIIFLQRLVESYSGCPGEAAAEVAKEVGKYGDNRALVAALAGDWLKREGCRREAVAEALRRAQGRSVDFALDYIWYAVLGGSSEKAYVYAPLIVLIGLYGPIPVKLAEGILVDLGNKVRGSEVVRWFAKWHHSTLEKAIEKAALSPVNREKIEPEELYQALVDGFNELKKRGLIEKEKKAIDSDRIIDLIRSGLADDMSQLSEEEKRRCVKRVAFILGHAWALHPSLPRRGDLHKEVETVLGDALEPCVVDDYVTADGIIAPIVLTPLAFEAAGLLYLVRAPAEAAASTISLETLKALVDSWRRRGSRHLRPFTLWALQCWPPRLRWMRRQPTCCFTRRLPRCER